MRCSTPAVLAAACSLLTLAGAARADLVEITFTGTVFASQLTPMPAGQPASLVIVYDSSTAPQFIQNQQAFYVNAMRSITFTAGSYVASNSGAFGQIVVYDNLGGGDGMNFQVAANQATYQFTNPRPNVVNFPGIVSSSVPMTFAALGANLVATNSSVLTGFGLPTAFNAAQFNFPSIMTLAFSGDSAQINMTSVSSRLVPAPSAATTLALAGLFASRRRRSSQI